MDRARSDTENRDARTANAPEGDQRNGGAAPEGANRLPSKADAKAQAKRLRSALAAQGTAISHSQALELVAQQHGHRDWNTLHAAINAPSSMGWAPGDRIRGHYLSHPISATVVAAKVLAPGWFRVSIDLDEAVDVVKFEGMTAFRKRINGVVGPNGRTRERTSDGRPHLELERAPQR